MLVGGDRIKSRLDNMSKKYFFYNGKKFDADQMREIRIGQQIGIDVNVYADPKFDADQMTQIRDGLDRGINASLYANPQYSWAIMEEIRIAMLSGLDVNGLLQQPHLQDTQMLARRIQAEAEQLGGNFRYHYFKDDEPKRYALRLNLADGTPLF